MKNTRSLGPLPYSPPLLRKAGDFPTQPPTHHPEKVPMSPLVDDDLGSLAEGAKILLPSRRRQYRLFRREWSESPCHPISTIKYWPHVSDAIPSEDNFRTCLRTPVSFGEFVPEEKYEMMMDSPMRCIKRVSVCQLNGQSMVRNSIDNTNRATV